MPQIFNAQPAVVSKLNWARFATPLSFNLARKLAAYAVNWLRCVTKDRPPAADAFAMKHQELGCDEQVLTVRLRQVCLRHRIVHSAADCRARACVLLRRDVGCRSPSSTPQQGSARAAAAWLAACSGGGSGWQQLPGTALGQRWCMAAMHGHTHRTHGLCLAPTLCRR